MLSIMNLDPSDTVLAEAETCRKEAQAAVKQNSERYAALKNQPSGWCVVTQKGLWSRSYHNAYGELQLRDCLDRGHKVLLTVGIVANPELPLRSATHLASVKVAQPGKLSEGEFDLISIRAKLHALRAARN
jgi:hypothetical protein